MKETILNITESQERKLFQNGHYIFDSSALLDLFEYSDKSIESFFNKVFKELKGKLFLPGHVNYEFEKNRQSVILKPIQLYNQLFEKDNSNQEGGYISSIESILNQLVKSHKELSGQLEQLHLRTKKDDKHPILKQVNILKYKEEQESMKKSVDSLKKKFVTLKNSINKQVTLQEKKIISKSKKSTLRKNINELFSLGEQYSYELLSDIVKEGKFRYDNKIPPGYEDDKEKIGFQKYGDLIIWKQLIDYASEKKKPIVFVTNDTKEDWWEDSDANTIPRHELIYEFTDKTEQVIWFYNLETFFFKVQSYLQTSLDEASKDNIKDIARRKARESELKWLELLKEALANGEDVTANHTYKFDNKSLGTFLSNVSQDNKLGKKLSLRKEIEDIGFDYHIRGRSADAIARRFIDKLLYDESPVKMSYQTRFNGSLMSKKDDLSPDIKKELEDVWELKFGEKRIWQPLSRIKDRTDEWKAFRYDKKRNPKQKWSTNEKSMGDLYYWVRYRKKNPEFLKMILDKFNERELEELIEEGFPVNEIR